MTIRDFMNYLKYIEHAAENLQFFLWFHDYNTRFNNLRESERDVIKVGTVIVRRVVFILAAPEKRRQKIAVDAFVVMQWHLSFGVAHGIDGSGLTHGGQFLAQSFGRPTPKGR